MWGREFKDTHLCIYIGLEAQTEDEGHIREQTRGIIKAQSCRQKR